MTENEKHNTSLDDLIPDEQEQEAVREEGRIAAALGYIPFLFFIPLWGMSENSFAQKHGRQSLLLLPFEIIALTILAFPDLVKFSAQVLFLICIGLAGVGAAHALQKKNWKIPYLSDWIQKYGK